MPKEEKGDGLQSYSIREKLLSKPNGKFGLKALKTKAINFFSLNQDYLSYQQEYLGLSVKELASTGELPQIDCATYSSLEDGYRDMAADRQYNREANEWIKISGETLKDESL